MVLDDGIGDERFQARFPRVGHGLERLVVIGNDGVVSLAALRWLADQNAAFVMLDRDGLGPAHNRARPFVRCQTPPCAQARANDTGAALQISRALIHEKLARQEQVVREKLKDSAAADAIAESRNKVPVAPRVETIRFLEADGAGAYWAAWQRFPVTFPRKDLARIPEHWRVFGWRGLRHSRVHPNGR